jgi:rubrerythrin
MSKKLCKLVKDEYLDDYFKDYMELVNKGKYICKKCGRVANDESNLCKPKELKASE